ncbi:FAD binding domain-containing protein [Alphaproteobacteria bacterium]|nr:FAD binding domain-containing protein [Alphaproteobacteria bacterium]
MLILEKINNIFINGKKETIKNVDHDITLLDWLRNNLKMTGTKEGCAEGDCGACSVIINEENNSNIKPVNSCLVRLGQVIGKNIITIEGLGNENDPHPLQVAFSKENASQCGYCTPGFIVAGVSLLNSNKEINDNTINDAFSGNLCRCTGYSPIINAVKSVAKAQVKIKCKNFTEETKDIKLGNVTYYHPKKLDELQNLTKIKNFKFLAGGTDLNLQRTIINQSENAIISLSSVEELKKVELSNNKILLGSSVTIETFLEIIECKIPEMIEILQRFGSPQIRNQGTIGGNLCTSSPIGDLAPVLLVLNSSLNIFGKKGSKNIHINDFFKGYRKNILKNDEILVSIEIPIPQKINKLFFWKLSKRFDQDISTISLAINIEIQNQVIQDLHIAAGGVAEIPIRLDDLSKQMINKNIDEAIKLAIDKIDNYIRPISDLRGTSVYRKESLKGLFKRLQKCLENNVKNMSVMEF